MENIEIQNKRILIAWAGNIWITLGALLENRGHQVTLVGGKKLKSLGNFVNIDGKKFSISNKEYILPRDHHFDYVFVTSKLYDTKYLIQQILKNNIKYENIAIIQNWLVPDNFYSEIWLKNFLTISVYEWHNLLNNQITLSKNWWWRQLSTDKISQDIADIFNKSGIEGKITEDIERNRAIKMILNCSVNGLSAFYKKSIKELLNENKHEIEQIMKECYEVLSKKFNLWTYEEIKKNSLSMLERMWSYFPSTYQDVISWKQTEIDFLNWYIVKEGKKYAISVPMNTWIYKEIKQIEKRI